MLNFCSKLAGTSGRLPFLGYALWAQVAVAAASSGFDGPEGSKGVVVECVVVCSSAY